MDKLAGNVASRFKAAAASSPQELKLPSGWVLKWDPRRPDRMDVNDEGDTGWSDEALLDRGRIRYDSPERIPSPVKSAVEKFFRKVKRMKTAATPKWDKAKVKRWMQQNVGDYVDRKTDEVNATEMAEAAANEFEIYEDKQDYNIPEEVFDLSADVAEAHEKKIKRTAALQDGPVGRVLNKWWNEIHDLEHDLREASNEYDSAASYSGGAGRKAAQDMLGDIEDCQKLIDKLAGHSGAFNKLFEAERRFIQEHGEPSAYVQGQRDRMFPR